jgi:branched-chain amino acid transport system permease protein
MLYRENGQFKTDYAADQQIFPIRQDRIAMALLLVPGLRGVPLLADEYMFRAILIPFLILSLAALGLNILVGYCGQISAGHRRLHGGGRLCGLQLLRCASKACR